MAHPLTMIRWVSLSVLKPEFTPVEEGQLLICLNVSCCSEFHSLHQSTRKDRLLALLEKAASHVLEYAAISKRSCPTLLTLSTM